MARLAIARIPVGDEAMRVSESMLSLLKAGGVGDQAAAYAADLISMYASAIAYEQSLYGAQHDDPEQEGREIARITGRFAALDAERYPTIAALGPAIRAATGPALRAGPRRHRRRPARNAGRRRLTDPA